MSEDLIDDFDKDEVLAAFDEAVDALRPKLSGFKGLNDAIFKLERKQAALANIGHTKDLDLIRVRGAIALLKRLRT